MKVFLSVSTFLIAALGCAWLLLPAAMLGRWGVQSDLIGLYMGRRYGTMLLGYAVILAISRAAGPSVARTAVLAGGAFDTGLITLVSVGGILGGIVGTGAWLTVAVEALLACGFLYFAVRGREMPEGKATS